ncbi:MAG: heme ABC exporter ATP-binding protein CcmA [Legionellaceae bacterium]|nr:heme ABC exporter ATP-binding protein CcmA [Legionellaceae bacterium]
MLHVTNLVFDYHDKLLLQNVSFFVKKGIVLHVKGENGAGKTTLLKLLAGLLQPISGEIVHKEKLAYVGHQNGVNTRLTPKEHIRCDLNVTDDAEVNALLVRLHLHAVRNVPCALLSAGQKRRVGLLRLLVMDAKLWLLDEPLVGLDEAGMQILGDLIRNHLSKAGSVILTSHQILPFDLGVQALQALYL